MTKDSPPFSENEHTQVVRINTEHGSSLRRMLYQSVFLGKEHCRNSVLLTTDSKSPFFLPSDCDLIPLITDLAVYRMPEVYQFSRTLWWRLQYRYVRRRTKCFLAISEFTKREIEDVFRISPEKIHVVPCACSESLKRVEEPLELERLRTKYHLPERFVLFVGNNNPRKNLDRVIQAFDGMKKSGGLPHHLVIAGEQGWKFDQEKAVSRLSTQDAVHFIGFVPDEDMSALYSASELFLFPTLYEGFGIPVLEAQQCGVPVLTSRCSSLPEVGGEGAYYVDPYDIQDIQNGMEKLLTDQELARTLVCRGYENARRFSWEKSAQCLDEIIEREMKQ